MPVNTQLEENGFVLSMVISDPFMITDLLATYTQAQSLFDNSTHKIHTLVDLRAMKNVPRNALTGRNSPSLWHQNSGYVVIVGGSLYAEEIIKVAFKIVKYDRVKFFKDISLAWDFLRTSIAKDEVRT